MRLHCLALAHVAFAPPRCVARTLNTCADQGQARRQFNVCDDPLLRYKYLNAFDAAMNNLEAERGWLASPQGWVSLKNQADRVVYVDDASTR